MTEAYLCYVLAFFHSEHDCAYIYAHEISLDRSGPENLCPFHSNLSYHILKIKQDPVIMSTTEMIFCRIETFISFYHSEDRGTIIDKRLKFKDPDLSNPKIQEPRTRFNYRRPTNSQSKLNEPEGRPGMPL